MKANVPRLDNQGGGRPEALDYSVCLLRECGISVVGTQRCEGP